MKTVILSIPNTLVGFLTAYEGFGLDSWQFWAITVPVAAMTGVLFVL